MSNEDDFPKLFLNENNKFKITPIEITFMPSKSKQFLFQGKFERLEHNAIDDHEDNIQEFNDTFFHFMLPVFIKKCTK